MSCVSFIVSPAGLETLSNTAAGVPRQPRCREPGEAGITVKPVQRARVTIAPAGSVLRTTGAVALI